MKINVDALDAGPPLDWAVATAEGVFTGIYAGYRVINEKLCLVNDEGDVFNTPYCPSSMWSLGGPIIEREMKVLSGRLTIRNESWASDKRETYRAEYVGHNWEQLRVAYGPTPLVAAMRCFVASRLGRVIEIPEDLS